MGSRGPVPKREESRQRRNKPERPVRHGKSGMTDAYRRPPANKYWSKLAKRIWRDLEKSGQSAYYEPSDWVAAYLLCDTVTAFQESDMKNGQMLASINALMTELLMTEGARRRAGVELSRKTAEEREGEANIARMDKWQRKMSSI